MKKISLFLVMCLVVASFNMTVFAGTQISSIMVDIPVDASGETYTNSDGVTTTTKIVRQSASPLTTNFVSDDPVKGSGKILRAVCDNASGKAISYNDYMQYNVKDSGLFSISKPHDYVVTSFDVLLGEDLNGVALENRFDGTQSLVLIESNANSGNVWNADNCVNRNQIVVEPKKWHKIDIVMPWYGENVMENGTLKYNRYIVYVDGKLADYKKETVVFPDAITDITNEPRIYFMGNTKKTVKNFNSAIDNLTVTAYDGVSTLDLTDAEFSLSNLNGCTVDNTNKTITLQSNMTGSELENLVLSSNNISVAKTISDYKTAVGANVLKTGDQLAIRDLNGNYTYYSINEPEVVIVSNEEYMSDKVLTTLESGYLEGYQKVYAVNSQDIFNIDAGKKDGITAGNILYYEVILRSKDVSGKVELDVLDSSGKGILANETYTNYFDSADNGKNLYYITPSWTKISMPYTALGTETSLKIVPDSQNGIEIASVKLVNYINKMTLEDMLKSESGMSGMFDLSGAHNEVITFNGSTSVDKTMSVIYKDGYVYSMGSGRVTISKISANNELEIVSKIQIGGILRQIDITEDGNTLVVSGRYYGVYVIDVKDKQKPIVYRYDSVEFATGVAVYKNYAFIANRIFGVEVLDISDVKNLRQVAVIRCGEAQSCDVVDGVLYAGLWAQPRVDMFDITDLNNHKLIGSVPLSGRGDGFAVEKDGDKTYLYAATGQHTYEAKSPYNTINSVQYGQGNGMDIYDITDPKNPVWQSTVKADGKVYAAIYDYWTTKIVKDNDKTYAYFSTGVDGIYAYDVTDKKAPKRIGHITVRLPSKYKPIGTGGIVCWDETKYTQSNVGNFDIKDGALFIGGELSDLHIVTNNVFPMKNRYIPTENVEISDGGVFHNLKNDMGIVDIIHYKNDNEQIQAVDVKDGLIYAACGTSGIKVFDENLKLLKTYPAGDVVSDIQIEGDTLYTADGKKGMRFYKVDGANLTEIGTPYVLTSVKQIEVSPNGKWAFVQNGTVTHIVNVSDPQSPTKHTSASDIIKNATSFFRPIMDGFAQNRYGVVLHSTGTRYIIDFGENCESDTPVLKFKYSCGTAGIRGGLCALPNGDIFTSFATGKYYLQNSPTDSKIDWATQKIWVNSIKETALSGKPYVSKTGNTLVIAEALQGNVTILGIDENNQYTNIIAEFKVNGNPNGAYVEDDCVVLTLGHQGIMKFTFDKSGIKVAKDNYKIKNDDGTYTLKEDIIVGAQIESYDNVSGNAQILVAEYTKEGALVRVQPSENVGYGAVNSIIPDMVVDNVQKSGNYFKIYLIDSDNIIPLSNNKKIEF